MITAVASTAEVSASAMPIQFRLPSENPTASPRPMMAATNAPNVPYDMVSRPNRMAMTPTISG